MFDVTDLYMLLYVYVCVCISFFQTLHVLQQPLLLVCVCKMQRHMTSLHKYWSLCIESRISLQT